MTGEIPGEIPMGKRLFDIALALSLGLVFLPVIACLASLILLLDGQAPFYASERMKTCKRGFLLWKLRSMRYVAHDSGVSGGDKAGRITHLGRWLRRSHFDELPQLWNILRGDMSFVGPRPPLRTFVERCPDVYARVLWMRPGLTGFATLMFRAREAQLLAVCTTHDETDAVYMRRCIPIKARLDLIYQRNQSLCFDIVILARTFRQALPSRH